MKETLDEQSRRDLVKYRIDRAYETLKEADLLADNSFYNAAVNRLYYACYYATVALLLKHGIMASTHAGVKSMLGLHLLLRVFFQKSMDVLSAGYLKFVIVVTMMILCIVMLRWCANIRKKQRYILMPSESCCHKD